MKNKIIIKHAILGAFVLITMNSMNTASYAQETGISGQIASLDFPSSSVEDRNLEIKNKIRKYANKHSVSYDEMDTVIKCESNYNVNAYNGKDSHADSVGSHGIAQFADSTIKGFGEQIGIENPDPYNIDDALDVMAYMFSLGEEGKRHWTCWRMHYDK